MSKLIGKLLCFLGLHKTYHGYFEDGKGNSGCSSWCSRCGKNFGHEEDWFNY